MVLKKLISIISVFAIITSLFTTVAVNADEEMTPIACTQSVSYLTDGDGNVTQTIANYAGRRIFQISAGIQNQIHGAVQAFSNLMFLPQMQNA